MKLAQFLTRLVVVVYICGLMAFANVVPAIAGQSNLNKGMEQLPKIQTKAEDATKARPYGSDKVQYESNQGLNEVQGNADFDRMKRGANEDTPPAVRQIEKAFDKVGDKINSAKDDSGIGSALDKAGDAANYVKDKAGDVLGSVTDKAGDTINSLTGKAADTAESIKDSAKSLVDKGADKAGDAVKSLKQKAEDAPESIKYNNVRAFEEGTSNLRERASDLQSK